MDMCHEMIVLIIEIQEYQDSPKHENQNKIMIIIDNYHDHFSSTCSGDIDGCFFKAKAVVG